MVDLFNTDDSKQSRKLTAIKKTSTIEKYPDIFSATFENKDAAKKQRDKKYFKFNK